MGLRTFLSLNACVHKYETENRCAIDFQVVAWSSGVMCMEVYKPGHALSPLTLPLLSWLQSSSKVTTHSGLYIHSKISFSDTMLYKSKYLHRMTKSKLLGLGIGVQATHIIWAA